MLKVNALLVSLLMWCVHSRSLLIFGKLILGLFQKEDVKNDYAFIRMYFFIQIALITDDEK